MWAPIARRRSLATKQARAAVVLAESMPDPGPDPALDHTRGAPMAVSRCFCCRAEFFGQSKWCSVCTLPAGVVIEASPQVSA